MNRKDFFKHGRLIILSGIGLFSAFLAYDQKIAAPGDCSVAPQCRNCGKFVQCELPQAIKEKRDGK